MRRTLIQHLSKGVAKHISKQILAALSSGSDEEIVRMTKFWERLALVEDHRVASRKLREIIVQGHPIGKWLKRLSSQLNESCRTGFVENVFFNSMFVGEEKRLAFRDREGFRRPILSF